MPQAWIIGTPSFFSYSSMRLFGAAEPPTTMRRTDERSKPSFSTSSLTAIHTVGTAPTHVTFSACTISAMSRGWGAGPPKIWVAPTRTPAYGTHQALAWNIGAMWRMTSRSGSPRVSVIATAIEWRKIARWLYTTPLGCPVVPEG